MFTESLCAVLLSTALEDKIRERCAPGLEPRGSEWRLRLRLWLWLWPDYDLRDVRLHIQIHTRRAADPRGDGFVIDHNDDTAASAQPADATRKNTAHTIVA